MTETPEPGSGPDRGVDALLAARGITDPDQAAAVHAAYQAVCEHSAALLVDAAIDLLADLRADVATARA